MAYACVVGLPLLLWLGYIRWRVGPADAGFGNFTWPAAGWVLKWIEIGKEFTRAPEFTGLIITTLLATIGLTVQVAYFFSRWDPRDPWWRIGAVYGLMLLFLGTSVWEGHPGAATRVMLPLGLAFVVRTVRQAASPKWIFLGSLSVFAGITALWSVPRPIHEFAAGRTANGSFTASLGAGWFPVEHGKKTHWAWSGKTGEVQLDVWRAKQTVANLQFHLRAIARRTIEIKQDNTVLWRGVVDTTRQLVEIPVGVITSGRVVVEITTTALPILENSSEDARALSIAIYDVRVE
jgi:hypothetical protein